MKYQLGPFLRVRTGSTLIFTKLSNWVWELDIWVDSLEYNQLLCSPLLAFDSLPFHHVYFGICFISYSCTAVLTHAVLWSNPYGLNKGNTRTHSSFSQQQQHSHGASIFTPHIDCNRTAKTGPRHYSLRQLFGGFTEEFINLHAHTVPAETSRVLILPPQRAGERRAAGLRSSGCWNIHFHMEALFCQWRRPSVTSAWSIEILPSCIMSPFIMRRALV